MLIIPPSAVAQGQITAAQFRRLSANGIYPGGPPQSIVASQVDTATEFLSLLTPTRTPRLCSYYLKHIAERWGRSYVSNGAMIAAAVARGLVVETYAPWWAMNPNVTIGVSRKSLTALTARGTAA